MNKLSPDVRQYSSAILLVCIVIFFSPQWITALYQNLGFIALTKTLAISCSSSRDCLAKRLFVLPSDDITELPPTSFQDAFIHRSFTSQTFNQKNDLILGWLHLARSDYDQAVHHLQKAVDERNPQPRALIRLGDAYLGQGLPDLALIQYEKALQLAPDNPDAQTGLIAHHLVMLAQNATQHATLADRDDNLLPNKIAAQYVVQADEVGLALVRHLVLNDLLSFSVAQRLLTGFSYNQANPDAIEEVFTTLIQQQAEASNAAYVLGLLVQSQGKIETAIQQFELVQHTDKTNAAPLFRLGLLYQKANQLDNATLMYQGCLQRSSSHQGCLAGLTVVSESDSDRLEWQQRLIDSETHWKSNEAQYQLGPNLISNGNFERPIENPSTNRRIWYLWTHSFAQSALFGEGYFLGGRSTLDSYRDNFSLYLSGLWAEKNAGHGVHIDTITLEPSSRYVLQFAYKTDQGSGRPVVYAPLVPNEPQRDLPPTHNNWLRVSHLIENTSTQPYELNISVRIWGEIELWVDDMSLRRVGELREK